MCEVIMLHCPMEISNKPCNTCVRSCTLHDHTLYAFINLAAKIYSRELEIDRFWYTGSSCSVTLAIKT